MEEIKPDAFMAEIYELLNYNSESRDVSQLIEKKMADLGISERQLSKILGIERPSLKRLKAGETKKLDLLTILKLVQFLGLGVDEFIKLYVSQLPSEIIGELEKVRKANFITEAFDIKALKKVGFIESTTDFLLIEKTINSHFGFTSIFEYRNSLAYSLFSRTKKAFSDRMLEFWVKSAYAKFEKIKNPNDFDLKALKDLIPKIRPHTRDIEFGLLKVAKALYNLGVSVIIQEYLPNTQIRGATFLINDKPCIALSNYRHNYSTLWFALMHEIAHVLFDLEKIRDTKYHITGMPDLFLIEDDADHFAQELLFSQEKIDYIKPFITSQNVVEEYAFTNKVHQTIIYNFYINTVTKETPERKDELYSKFSRLIHIDSSTAVRHLNTSAWNHDSFVREVETIKNILSNIELIQNEHS